MQLSTGRQATWVSLILTGIFLYSLIFNINIPIEPSHGDTFHVSLTLKHYVETVLNSRWDTILTMPMFYGYPHSVLYSELFIEQGVFAFPIYLIFRDIIVTYNILAVLTIASSVFSMFIFAKYLTKSFWPAVLASIIYVFNPFVIGHLPDNLHYYSLQWIPLIFLYFEKFLHQQTKKNGFFLFVFLTLQLLTTVTFGALLTVIMPIYALIRIFQLKLITKLADLKKFINAGIIIGLLLFSATAYGINSLYGIYFHGQSFGRDLAETAVFSPWVYDLFLTSPNNLIYGGLRDWSQQNLSLFFFNNPEHVERNLFFGLGVWGMLLASFFVVRKSPYQKLWWACLIPTIIAILLSFGPRIRFTEYFSIPGIYELVHQVHPLLQNLRVASRFMVLAFMFIGIISALTLLRIQDRLQGRLKLWVSLGIICVVILEYSSVPWVFKPIPEEIKKLYSVVENQQDVEVLLELPMGNLFSRIGFARGQFVDTSYMLYASVLHNKKLLNGYSSYTPVSYPARIEYLTVNFPTGLKIKTLQKWGVDAIVMHREEFDFPDEYDRIKTDLEKLEVEKISEMENLVLFKIKDWNGF